MIKKSRLIVFLLIIILGGVAFYFYFGGNKKTQYEFAVAKRTNIIQEVDVTGKVRAAKDVDLAFEKGGRVEAVYAEVGEKVGTGQVLVVLEHGDISAQLLAAQANVKVQKAKLDELRRGTRPEEIQVQETKVENAKTALQDAKKNLVDKLQDAYTKSDDAVRNKADQIFSNPRSSNPQLVLLTSDSQLKTSLESGRVSIESIFKSWQASLVGLTLSSDFVLFVSNANKNLEQIKSFLDKAALAVNGFAANSNFIQTTIDGWKSDISTARTNVNTAVVNLSAADEKLRTTESSLTLEEQELLLEKAGTPPEQVDAQEAEVEQAEANVKNYEALIAKMLLRVPFEGTVTRQDAKVGEIVSQNISVVSLMSVATFQIEASVSEADIAKIAVGNKAKVTLDALGSEAEFNAQVVSIDPAETIIEGVPTYKTTFVFEDIDPRIKSGMTANLTIITARRDNVIVIPQRALIIKDGGKSVLVSTNDLEPKEIKVETGLRGSDGNIEILSGLKEGDRVATISEK